MKLKLITIIICLFIANMTFSQQLFGHVNSQDILSAMPEAATAQLTLQSELETMQLQGQTLMKEFENLQLKTLE